MKKKDYTISATVDTVDFQASYGNGWHGSCLVPRFRVQAASRDEAVALAKRIVDPLDLCKVNITARPVKKQPGKKGKK